jgi:hypothetical protein
MSNPDTSSVHSRSTRLLLRGVLLTERSHAMRLSWNAKNRSCCMDESFFAMHLTHPFVSYFKLPAAAPSSYLPSFVEGFRDAEQFVRASGERANEPAQYVKSGLLAAAFEFRDVGSMQ